MLFSKCFILVLFHLKINVYVTGLNSLMNLDKLGHIDDKNIGLLNNSPENSIFEQ